MSVVLAVLMQAEPAAQAGRELTGVVVDAQGQPAAGVAVFLSSLDRVDGENPTLGRTTSDPQGRFRSGDSGRGREGCRGSAFPTVWADRPGTSIGVALFRSAAARTEGGPRTRADAPIKLTLGAPESVAVRVVDPQGRPVGAARVSPLYVERHENSASGFGSIYSLGDPQRDRRSARRADRRPGHRQGRGPAAGRADLRFASQTPRFGTQTVTLQGSRPDPLEARLGAVGRLIGQVKGDDPAAAQGLRVRVETHPKPPTPGNPFVYSPDGEAEAVIDAGGQFEVPALAAGMLSVSLRTRDGKPARDLPAEGRAIQPGKTTELTVKLEGLTRLRAVEGRVVDRQGKPVAGALVFQSGDGPSRTRASTHDDGRFRLEGINSEGPAFVFARKRGFRFHGQRIDDAPGPITLTLTRTEETPPDVLRTRPSPLPHKEELALARRVLDA